MKSRASLSSAAIDLCRKYRLRCVLLLSWLSTVGAFGTLPHRPCDLELFETREQGQYVCSSHPDLVSALQTAEEIGRKECERAFEWERWNCSSFSILKTPNITSRVTKEAAYVHALSLVAVAYAVAEVCTTGEATSCLFNKEELYLPPDYPNTTRLITYFNSAEFGLTFARKFLLKRYTAALETPTLGREFQVLLHNLMVAEQVFEDMSVDRRSPCKCVGISGSCTWLTCLHELPDFANLAETVLKVYLDNTRYISDVTSLEDVLIVDPPISEGGSTDELNSTHSTNGDADKRYFLYLTESPDYCAHDRSLGSLGTVGRECDPRSTGPNSCFQLCTLCRRTPLRFTRTTHESCNCVFHYCCDFSCEKCTRTKEFYLCV